MADPVNPFNPAELEKYKEFFLPPERKGFPTAAELEAERSGLASFLGTTDYTKQLTDAQDLGKLQLALALAQRGFAAAGATPVRGETPVSTLSRELLSPLAGDAGAVASQMIARRQALKDAERQEERQLKLAALQNVKKRQEQDYAADVTATQQARQLMTQVMQQGDTVSNDYTVNGENVPLIVRKNWTGELEGFYTLDGTKLDNATVKVWRTPPDAIKPITSWATDVHVRGPGGTWIPAPGALRIADATGENSRVVHNNVTLDFNPESSGYNARIVKPESKDSPYYAPTSRPVFLNQTAIDLFDLDKGLSDAEVKGLLGQKALFREYLVRPDMEGPNTRPIKELVVSGKSFRFDSHRGYNPETGNITVERGADQVPVTYEATQLFREEDPKQFVSAGTMIVPPANLSAIQLIPGLEGVTAGDKLDIERNDQGKVQIRRANVVISLTDEQSALFQTQPLTPVQLVEARQVIEPKTAFVNTSNRTLQIGDQTVGAGQIGYFTKTDQASNAFMDVASSFRKVGDVSTDAVTYMFKDPRTIGDVEYVPGDEIRYSPQEFENLSDDLKIALTDDTALRATTLKKNYFKALWKTVIERENLPESTPTTEQLESLLGMFPAGMRSGGKNLRDEIFSMIKYGVDPDAEVPAEVVSAKVRVFNYEKSVANQLDAAQDRYEDFVARGALPEVDWDSLSFEAQRAFADVKSVVQLQNVQGLWANALDRLAKDKASYTNLNQDDVASYAAVSELLILARYLRNSQDVDTAGRFFGWFGGLRANLFADIEPITSGGTQRLQSVINAMKSRYATLAGQEGEGRPSDFRVGLQQELIPAFVKAESLNKRNLDIMIQRLEIALKSAFTPEILSTTVIPSSFETMAAEADVVGKTDPKRYRWVDPSVSGPVPVTRESVLSGVLGLAPVMFEDVQRLTVGQRLPRSLEGVVYVKIRNLTNGTVVVQEALSDGRPNPDAPEVILTQDNFRK